MTVQKHEPNLLSFFLHKTCIIEVGRNLEIKGNLLCFQLGSQGVHHRPFILIVRTQLGHTIVRGNRIAIKTVNVFR